MITVVESFGLLISGPLLAALFRAGLNQRDVHWLGLPFVVAGGMAALVAGLIWCIDLQPHVLQKGDRDAKNAAASLLLGDDSMEGQIYLYCTIYVSRIQTCLPRAGRATK